MPDMLAVDIASPFVDVALEFLSVETNLKFAKEPLLVPQTHGTSQDINILVGVTGDICGHVVFSMSLNASKIIAAIMLGRPVPSLDSMVQSALCELGNMISGSAIARLEDRYPNLALTPPTFIAGTNIVISSIKIGCLRSKLLASEIGAVDVTVALDRTAR